MCNWQTITSPKFPRFSIKYWQSYEGLLCKIMINIQGKGYEIYIIFQKETNKDK